ncbi:MAG: cation transporter [Nanoarchaeota archaeon]|nr:cation transporter [Nanoarchaeota archaeon]
MKIYCVCTILVLMFTAVSYSGHTQGVEKVTLKIEGMTGSCCAPSIKDALLKTNGVKKASVSFDDAEAVVEFNAKEVTIEQIISVCPKTHKVIVKIR